MNENITLRYSMAEPEKLFGIGYGIYHNRDRLLKKGDKVRPFPSVLKTVMLEALLLYAIAVAYLVLMIMTDFDVMGLLLLVAVVVYGMIMITNWTNNRRIYKYLLKRFLRDNGTEGTAVFDGDGITNTTAQGKETYYSWSDYRYCFFAGKTITFLFVNERDEFLVMDRTAQSEETVRRALEEFEMSHTIREAEMKGKK